MKKHNRHSIRLPFYDYSSDGAYFVTICTNDHTCLFGSIENGCMVLNDAGKIADTCWRGIPEHFPDAKLDTFVIMPNHVHGIIIIARDVGAKNFSPLQPRHGTSKTIGSIVRGYKIGVTKLMRQNTEHRTVVWQRNYYEHIIRNDESLENIHGYIQTNAMKWEYDEYYIK